MRSWLEVSLGRIRENFGAVRNAVGAADVPPTIDVMAVVKADAYGHGALEVSRVLEDAGAGWLAVSNVEEGVALRLAGIKARILVMADFLPESRAALKEFGLTPVIHSLADVAAVEVPYHLKIDTGMGRLGTRATPETIVEVVAAGQSRLEGVMTHFASSANFESGQTEEQIAHAWKYAYCFFFLYPAPFPWHLLHFLKELKEWPVGRVLSSEGQVQFGETFRYLVGEKREWNL